LNRGGGSRPQVGVRDVAAGCELELVALGLSNREVAAELVLTVHTVEAALTRVYTKLGVRSRTELARRFAEAAG